METVNNIQYANKYHNFLMIFLFLNQQLNWLRDSGIRTHQNKTVVSQWINANTVFI